MNLSSCLKHAVRMGVRSLWLVIFMYTRRQNVSLPELDVVTSNNFDVDDP